MKNMFRFSFIILLAALTFFGCKESGPGADNPNAGNQHNNERTNADWNVSGTTTVPAGTYNYIYVYNGSNITLSNGVNWAVLNWTNYTIGGAAATITNPVGSVVTASGNNQILPGANFINRGRLTNLSGGSLSVRGTFNDYGLHYVGSLTITGGNYFVRGGSTLESQYTFQDYENSSYGKITIELCNIAKLGEVHSGPSTTPFLWGRGMFNMTSCYVYNGTLTGDTKTKVCIPVPITYSGSGAFGIGALTCTNTCLGL